MGMKQIGADGWYHRWGLARIIRELVRRYYRHGVSRSSAALTYYLIFAAFPLLVFLSMLLGALQVDPDSVLLIIGPLLPQDVELVVRAYLDYVTDNYSSQLLWFSLIFSVWFPMRATSCLLFALRRAFGAVYVRQSLKETLLTALFTLWLLVSWGAAMVLMTVGRRALIYLTGLLHLSRDFADVWNYLRFALLGLVMFAALAVLYMLAMGSRRPLREVAPGVLISLAAWMTVSAAFSYYVEYVAQYTKLYGSITTVVVTLLWLYMSGTVLIMGAELNAVLRQRRQHRQ